MVRRVILIVAILGGFGNVAPRAAEDTTAVASDVDVESIVEARPLVYLVPVQGTIDGGLAEFIQRAVQEAESDSAAALLLEMNTYGGRVDAADKIRTALLETSVLTITFVHNNAASAGALISIATDTIAMSPGAAIGAATPVDQGGAPGSGKVISYFRSIMGETARATGRSPIIAEAMVDSSIVVPGFEDASRPLTLRTDQAIAAGIAQQEAKSLDDVLRLNGLENAEIHRIKENWAENVVRFLTNPMVSGLLLTIGALGLIGELSNPGFGLPGIAGIVCLGLFFGAHYIVDLAQWTDLLIFVIGVALLVAELFVPGGILGVLGAALVIIGLFMSLLGKIQYVTVPDLTDAFTSVGIAFILTVVGGAILLRGFAEMPVFKRLMLDTRQQPGRGDGVPATVRNELIGREGVVETNLRPAGRVRVGDRYYEATSEGDHIEVGTLVRIVGVDSLSGIIVRQI